MKTNTMIKDIKNAKELISKNDIKVTVNGDEILYIEQCDKEWLKETTEYYLQQNSEYNIDTIEDLLIFLTEALEVDKVEVI